MGVNLPQTKYLKPNTEISVGALVIFKYKTLKHYAVVTSIEDDGFWIKESNYRQGEYTKRRILFTDSAIEGFWFPG